MKKFPRTPSGFSRIEIKDDDGSVKRVTFNPWSETREIEETFLKHFGKVPELSIASRIIPHIKKGNIFFVKMDISDAFGSVRIESVNKVLGNRVDWMNKERLFFHPNGGVIQGSLSAPKIFEAFCGETIDAELIRFCSARGVTYTRYVDDLIFSSNRPMPKSLRRVFRKILRKYGLEPNQSKDKVVSTQNRMLKALGLVIYRGKVYPTNEFKESLDNLRRYEWFYENKVKGMEAWIRYVESMNLN